MENIATTPENQASEEYVYWGTFFDTLVKAWTEAFEQVATNDEKWPSQQKSNFPSPGHYLQKQVESDWVAPPNADPVFLDGGFEVKMGATRFEQLYRFWYSFYNDQNGRHSF